MKKLLSMVLCLAMILTCLPTLSFASDTPTGGISGLDSYKQYSVALESDGYIGIPVDIYTYYKDTPTTDSTIIIYVINTNTERIGTDSDESIVKDMMDKGYIVVVADYKNNAKSVSPDLDWSIQQIRTDANSGKYFPKGTAYKSGYTYVVPSGYNITLDDLYWSFDKHGANGSLQFIVDVWNSDFVGVYGNRDVTINGETMKVKDVNPQTIYECVKKDGTPIDLDLRMDIIYPTNPDHEVPVYILNSSSETRVGSWTNARRPHLTGFLFAGYAGVIYDYGYVPMSRTDNWGYFDGDGSGSIGGVTGDNGTYSLACFNQMKCDTAAIRKLRYMAKQENTIYKFDVDKFGIYGNSKGGVCTRLGEPHPELLNENRYFDGHYGETRYEAKLAGEAYEYSDFATDSNNVVDVNNGEKIIAEPEPQPWLTYEGTNETIPSNVQFVYANCGGGIEDITKDHAPTFASGSMLDGSFHGFYQGIIRSCRAGDVPCLYFAMPSNGHEFVWGIDRDYGIDGYAALFDMAHYYLKGDGAILEYVDLGDRLTEVDAKQEIKFKFAGSIPESEITKITIKNDATGENVKGTWTDSFGDTEWIFKPDMLKGGLSYTITVPKTLKGDNGKEIQKGKTVKFTVAPEKLVAPTDIKGDDNLTLLKTAEKDNAVYALYKGVDFENSTTTALRFNVTNDAANTVLVYGVSEINESDLTSSAQGDLIGEVTLTGAGDYEIDVTDYVAGGNKAAFILKAKKDKETKVISKFDFESSEVGATSVSGFAYNTTEAVVNVSDEKNTTNGGSKSLKYNYSKQNNYKNGKYHVWIEQQVRLASLYAVFGNTLKTSDIGRKFNISFNIYDDISRRVVYTVSPLHDDDIIYESRRRNETTKAGEWTNFTMDYRINSEIDVEKNSRDFLINLDSTFKNGKTGVAYLDDLVVTEQISEVNLADAATCFAPSLVLHPADKTIITPSKAAYAESGVNADKTMSDDAMYVSGRAKSIDDSATKTYIKLDISSYIDGQAYFGFKTTAASRGKIEVYALQDKELSESWSEDTINIYNAPANDRYGYGVDKSKMYDQAPIGEFTVNGESDFYIDITSYVKTMKALGSDSATLIFVNADEINKVVYEYDFDKSSVNFAGGGGIGTLAKSSDEDHTNGSGNSLKIAPTQYNYERAKLDILNCKSLTSEDVGRKFRVTYYVKSSVPASYSISLLEYYGANNHQNQTTETIDVADSWQKKTYDIELKTIVQGTTDDIYRGTFSSICFQNIKNTKTGENKDVELYVDDIKVEELGVGNVTIIPQTDVKADKVVSSENFDDWTTLTSYNGSVAGAPDGSWNGSGWETATLEITNEQDATSGTGKSIKFTPNKNYNRLKLYNIFDHDLTAADVGRTVKISFKAKVDNTNKTDTKFQYGLTSLYARSEAQLDTSVDYEKYVTKYDANGRAYEIQNLYDAQANATGVKPDNTDYSTNLYIGTEQTVAAADLGKWKTYSFDVTVTEQMLPMRIKNKWGSDIQSCAIGLLSIFSTGKTEDDGMVIYIDDILVTEAPNDDEETQTKVPYTYSQDFENVENKDVTDKISLCLGGWTRGVLLNDTWYTSKVEGSTGIQDIDGWKGISEEVNSTIGGSKSLKGYAVSNWCRMGIANMTNGNLTQDDIGQEYKVTFKLKADATGTFTVGLSTYPYFKAIQTKVITVDKADTWQKYTYTFNITEEVLNATGDNSSKGQFSALYLCPNKDFGQSHTMAEVTVGETQTKKYTITDPLTFYVDDVYATEVVEGAGSALAASEQASISQSGVSQSSLKVIGSNPDNVAKYIRKSYIVFDKGEYEKAQKATLKFDTFNFNGKTLKLWGLTENYPSELTYNSAPNFSEDESVANAYGTLPLTMVKSDDDVTVETDVTNYIKYHTGNEYVFAITSEDAGGYEYVSFDFESSNPFTKNVDYASNATVSVEGGELKLTGVEAGNGIKFYNMFGSDKKVVNKGEEYTISMDVTASKDTTITIGNANDTELFATKDYALTAGTKSTISLEFVAEETDIENLVNALVVNSSAACDFSIDNINIGSRNAAVIDDESISLAIEVAKEAEVPTVEKSSITINTNGTSVKADGSDIGESSTKEYVKGSSVALEAVGDGTFMYWKDTNSGAILSYDKEYTLSVGSDRNITAIFADDTGVYVTFKNANGIVLAEGLKDSVKVPQNPYVYGYVFAGWYTDDIKTDLTAGDSVAADKNTVYTAGYEKAETEYTVTVDGAENNYKYNDKVTVSAPETKEGNTFSYWKRDGEVVSYNKDYSFYVAGNTELTSVYGESAEAKNVLVMATPVMVDSTRLAFFTERNIAKGNTVIESGVLIGNAANLTIDTALIKAVAKNTDNKGQYTVRKKNVSSGQTWYGRAYVIYKDASGNVYTIYSNEVTKTID